MAHILRMSVDEHELNGTRCILFNEAPRQLQEGSLIECKDWLARFMIKLEARQVPHVYDDLLLELRIDLPIPLPKGIRRVAYQIKSRPLPNF